MSNRWEMWDDHEELIWDCQKHPEDHTDFLEMRLKSIISCFS